MKQKHLPAALRAYLCINAILDTIEPDHAHVRLAQSVAKETISALIRRLQKDIGNEALEKLFSEIAAEADIGSSVPDQPAAV